MFMKEMIGSCSLAPVAEAAVMSIGPAFFRRVSDAAEMQGVSIGFYAARAVRIFAARACAQDWQEIHRLCAGQDMPGLCAIQHILTKAMQQDQDERKSSPFWPTIVPPGETNSDYRFY